MKTIKYPFCSYLALALLCVPLQSVAQLESVAQPLVRYHTTLCGAVTSQHHDRLEYLKLGVLNKDPEAAAWVNCPATLSTQDLASGIPEDFAIRATNTGSETAELQCIYRVTDWSTEPVSSRDEAFTRVFQPEETATMTWQSKIDPAGNLTYLITCKLYPGMIINFYEFGWNLDE